ncbi:hypothetical protein NQL31_005645 [Lotmaria passim]
MTESPFSNEQRARLQELEARQLQLKRLCEEALKEDEEHQHIFQQLEEHNVAPSVVGSFRGTGDAATGGGGGAAMQPDRTATNASNDDPMDDLMTGEVRSFRDPNSITRASSTGSVTAAAVGGGSYLRNASLDRPAMTRLDTAYLPPTYPSQTDAASVAADPMPPPPPPPPRAPLYSTAQPPRADVKGPACPSVIPSSWRRNKVAAEAARPVLSSAQGNRDSGTAAVAATSLKQPLKYTSTLRTSAPLLTSPAAPPPPPRPERSRSLSHSMPLTGRFQRSGDYRAHMMPPPPPSAPSTEARTSPNAVRYKRSRVGLTSPAVATRFSPPPPSPPAPSTLLSPDEVTDDLPPPPPSNRRRERYGTPESRPSAVAKYRGATLFLSRSPPLPPPPPPHEHDDAGSDSSLSTTFTAHDLARWRNQLHRNDTNLQRGANRHSVYIRPSTVSPDRSPHYTGSITGGKPVDSWAEMQNRFTATPRALDRRFEVTAASGDSERATRYTPLPPPPPPPPPPPLNDDDDYRSSRWETISLTPSLKRAEEYKLRRYFATDEKVSPRSLMDYAGVGSRLSPSTWRSTEVYHADGQQRQQQRAPSTLKAEEVWSTASRTRVSATARTTTALHYDSVLMDDRNGTSMREAAAAAPLSSPLQSIPDNESTSQLDASAAAGATDAAMKAKKKKPVHPYGGQSMPHAKLSALPSGSSAASAAPLFSAMYAQQQRSAASTGLNSSRNSVWEHGDAGSGLSAAAGGAAVPLTPVAAVSEFFDMGPEKEALLTLLRESTRVAATAALQKRPFQADAQSDRTPSASRFDGTPAADNAGQPHGGAVPAAATAKLPHAGIKAPRSASLRSPRRQTIPGATIWSSQDVSRSTSAVLPPHNTTTTATKAAAAAPFSDGASESAPNASVKRASPQLQRQCEEAQAKAETLARHLVKAIADRKLLQDNVEELEQLVEECNTEMGRLQRIVEEQHHDASTSLGVQAALRAKEREVAVYEDEIRRLNGVLDDHLARTSTTRQCVQDGLGQSLVSKEAEIEAAMAELGMAHLAQRDAEERAGQLANELETAVEQIQFLDERLAEMERAAAAAQFTSTAAHLSTGDSPATGQEPNALAGTPLVIPSFAETQHWPVEARRAMAQLVVQAQGLLQQNAESERHAAMRLQHMEQTCNELQQHLRERGEEVEQAQQACQQLQQEKKALQACGEQWYQQLRDVKEDAQLVSEMVRTARGDAEDVLLASRVAEARVVEQHAAVAAASPFRPVPTAPSAAAVDVATLQKSAHFAQQVMGDFHAVARFLSSLRKMDIGDRNGYQILQSIAKGRSPAEGLFITADDAATPTRTLEHLGADATTEAKRRVREKKARVLQAVERALKLEAQPPPPPQNQSSATPSVVNERSSGTMPPLELPPRAEAERQPTVIEVVTAAVAPTMEPLASEATPVTRLAALPVEEKTDSGDLPDVFLDDVADELEPEPEVEVVATALQPARLGSYSYRGGSNGMVHSNVRRDPAELGPSMSYHSSQATPLPLHMQHSSSKRPATNAITTTTAAATSTISAATAIATDAEVGKSTQHSCQQFSLLASSVASATSPIPLGVNGKPICSALCMGDDENKGTGPPNLTNARPTAATTTGGGVATPPPPPSVSRPLRLSTTPSQPQSETREEHEASSAARRSVVDAGAVENTLRFNLLAAPFTPLRASPSGVDCNTSSITVVSSPSVTPQVSQHPFQRHTPLHSQLQQRQPPGPETEQTMTPVQPTAVQQTEASLMLQPANKKVAVGRPPPTPPPTSFLDGDTTLPSVSDIVPSEKAVPPTEVEEIATAQQQGVPRDATPDAPRAQPPHDTVIVVVDPLLLQSPLERPRPSQSSADEPPPRVVREESQPSQPGSHPKARSTTARPPPSPPAPRHDKPKSSNTHPTMSGQRSRDHAVGHRAASDDSNDDEATLFFREPPPRDTVQEVDVSVSAAAPPPSSSSHEAVAEDDTLHSAEPTSRVAVDLLSGDFMMPSRQSSGTRSAATAATAKASPRETAEKEAERKQERSRSPQTRRVVDDNDDDEPSLQFSAPPLPLPPQKLPRPVALPHAELEEEHHSNSNSYTYATSHEVSLGLVSPVSASVTPTTEHEPPTDQSVLQAAQQQQQQQSGPAHRPLHRPRRPQPTDAGLSLSSMSSGGSGVAPPRLQRSASASPSASAPLVGSAAPGSAGPQSSGRADMPGQSSKSSSLERTPQSATPALAEPQRASPASRPDVAGTQQQQQCPSSSTAAAAAAAAAVTEEPTEEKEEEAPLAEMEEEEVETLDTRSRTATPNRAASRPVMSAAAGEMSRAFEEEEMAATTVLLAAENGTIESFSMGVSQPADPLPAAPDQSRSLPGRTGESRSGGTSPRRVVQGGSGSSEPAPLPTVNVDAPELNTMWLRRASPKPAALPDVSDGVPPLPRGASTPVVTEAISSLPSSLRSRSTQSSARSPSSSTLNNSPPSEAAARRREDVTRILERIRAKREQEQKFGAAIPVTATAASPTSSSRYESEDPSFNGE